MSTTNRADYIAGLRQLADILEQHDDLPLPYHGTAFSPLLFMGIDADGKTTAAKFARAIPGVVTKGPNEDYMHFVGKVAGLSVKLIVYRDAVCERVVLGTETVTIPEQPATEAQPERVVEQEIVEWRCAPILADEQVSA